MEDPVVPLERNLYGHSFAGLLWERQFEKIPLKHGWEKIPFWQCLFVHREKGLFLSVYVDDSKNLAGKKQNLDPMWKVLNKDVKLGQPISFLDHVYLGCSQRQCQTSKDTVVEKLHVEMFVILHGLMIWVVMQRSAWNDSKQDDSTTLHCIYSMHL